MIALTSARLLSRSTNQSFRNEFAQNMHVVVVSQIFVLAKKGSNTTHRNTSQPVANSKSACLDKCADAFQQGCVMVFGTCAQC